MTPPVPQGEATAEAERRRRLPRDTQGPRRGGGERIGDQQHHPPEIEQQRRAGGRPSEPGDANQGEQGQAGQPPARGNQPHRGTSIFSMMPLSAASGVTPSSSSSGATATR